MRVRPIRLPDAERAVPSLGAELADGYDYVVESANPFWRYAVALDIRRDLPAIPFFRRSAAVRYMGRAANGAPWAEPILLRRGLRRVEVIAAGRRQLGPTSVHVHA